MILAFLRAIPKLMALVNRLEKDMGPEWPKIMNNALEAYAGLRNAKTPEDRDAALKRIGDSWSNN